MEAKQKRNPRSYKIHDTAYDMANKRAKKEGKKLANVVEMLVSLYGCGAKTIKFTMLDLPVGYKPEKKKK